MNNHASGGPTRVTLRTISSMAKENRPFACLTCYDATTARWLERAGVPVLLVGDSAAEVILGHSRTIDMPLDFAIELTAAVRRGAPNCLLMGDMPFMSYHCGMDDAVRNAGRFMTAGQADCVKLEMDATDAHLVQRLTRAGVPVVAHIGSRPQQAALKGGYTAAGRTARDLERIVEDAAALEAAGAVLLLIEAVPDEVTQAVRRVTQVPLIGIGAGTECHGQVLVIHDLLGLTDHPPRFAQAAASLGMAIQEAGRQWVERVARGEIGGQRYQMKPAE